MSDSWHRQNLDQDDGSRANKIHIPLFRKFIMCTWVKFAVRSVSEEDFIYIKSAIFDYYF